MVKDARAHNLNKAFNSYEFDLIKWPSACDLELSGILKPEMKISLKRYLEKTRAKVQDLLAADEAICFDWRVSNKRNPINVHRLIEQVRKQVGQVDCTDFDEQETYIARHKAVQPAYTAHAGMKFLRRRNVHMPHTAIFQQILKW